MAAPLSRQPSMLVMTVLSVTVASTTPITTSAMAAHSILVSRRLVTTHCRRAQQGHQDFRCLLTLCG